MRDRKRKTAFFDLDFSIRKKYISYLKKSKIFFLIEKSRSKNGVFRFRSRLRSGLTNLENVFSERESTFVKRELSPELYETRLRLAHDVKKMARSIYSEI